jgi:hypothetical protein
MQYFVLLFKNTLRHSPFAATPSLGFGAAHEQGGNAALDRTACFD